MQQILHQAFYSKKLSKHFILSQDISALLKYLQNNFVFKKQSHFIFSICIIYSKQIKYLLEETQEFHTKFSSKPTKKKRANINLQLLSDLNYQIDFESTVYNCFEEYYKERKNTDIVYGDNNSVHCEINDTVEDNNNYNIHGDNINDTHVINDYNGSGNDFLIDELPVIKKRRIVDDVIEYESDDKRMFRRIIKREEKKVNEFYVPFEIKKYFDSMKRPSIEIGRYNTNQSVSNANVGDSSANNAFAGNLSAGNCSAGNMAEYNSNYNDTEVNNNDFSVEVCRDNLTESFYEPFLSSEIEMYKIEDLPSNFIFNAEIQNMKKREKSNLFLQLLKGCSENKIRAVQEIPFGNICCEVI